MRPGLPRSAPEAPRPPAGRAALRHGEARARHVRTDGPASGAPSPPLRWPAPRPGRRPRARRGRFFLVNGWVLTAADLGALGLMIFDAGDADRSPSRGTFDVCVVGAGPAGITLARSLAAQGPRRGADGGRRARDHRRLPGPSTSARSSGSTTATSTRSGCASSAARPATGPGAAATSTPRISAPAARPLAAGRSRRPTSTPTSGGGRDPRPRPPARPPTCRCPERDRLPRHPVPLQPADPLRREVPRRDRRRTAHRLALNANLVDLRLDDDLATVDGRGLPLLRARRPGLHGAGAALRARLGGIENPRLLLNFAEPEAERHRQRPRPRRAVLLRASLGDPGAT